MRYTFVQMKLFSSLVKSYKLSQEDMRRIENELMEEPAAWPVMAGTGGLRKMRFAPSGSGGGKSGGLRICYLVIPEYRHIHFLTMYAKNEAQNLTAGQTNQIAAVVRDIKNLYAGGN